MIRHMLAPEVKVCKEGTHRERAQGDKYDQVLADAAVRGIVMVVVAIRPMLIVRDCVIALL